MDRREFFFNGLRKASRAAVKGVDEYASRRSSRWIRPPYALDELEFLLACTRCGECVSACPHGSLFGLSARLGAQVAATPALDLLNKACHLCSDWPCVSACEPGALTPPQPAEPQAAPPPPRLALAQIDTRACLPYTGPECGACRGVCPVPEAMLWDRDKPRIAAAHCVGCALCRQACIVESKAIRIRSRHAEDAQSNPV